MHDFAKTTKKRSGLIASPFGQFQQQLRWQKFLLFIKKLMVGVIFLGASLMFSLGLLSFYFIHVAVWHGDSPLGIAVLTSEKNQILKETSIVWIDPGTSEMTLFAIPGNLSVHTSQPGSYTLAALYGLYALDQAPPGQFLKALVRNIRIDTSFLIVREGNRAPNTGTLRAFLLGTLFDTHGIYNFSFADRFTIFWYALFGSARSIALPFPTTVAVSDQGLDDFNYDKLISKNFSQTRIKQEALAVAVVNASSQNRLAITVGRIFSVLGLNILSVSDTPNTQDKGAIVVANGKLMDTSTVALLSRYVEGRIQVSPDIVSQYRSDVVVFLGKTEASVFTP